MAVAAFTENIAALRMVEEVNAGGVAANEEVWDDDRRTDNEETKAARRIVMMNKF